MQTCRINAQLLITIIHDSPTLISPLVIENEIISILLPFKHQNAFYKCCSSEQKREDMKLGLRNRDLVDWTDLSKNQTNVSEIKEAKSKDADPKRPLNKGQQSTNSHNFDHKLFFCILQVFVVFPFLRSRIYKTQFTKQFRFVQIVLTFVLRKVCASARIDFRNGFVNFELYLCVFNIFGLRRYQGSIMQYR